MLCLFSVPSALSPKPRHKLDRGLLSCGTPLALSGSQGGRKLSLNCQHGMHHAAVFALSGTWFRKSQVWRELELRLKPMCMLMCFPTWKMPAGGCCSVHSCILDSCKAGSFAICFHRFWRSISEGRSPTFCDCQLWCLFSERTSVFFIGLNINCVKYMSSIL